VADDGRMRINVTFGRASSETDLEDNSTALDLLRAMRLRPDAFIISRSGAVIPVDSELREGDSVTLIRVASGG